MLELPTRHVHLWCLTMDCSPFDLAFWASLLCADERVRADRLRHQRDRRFFIWYRGNVRRILASYCGSAPQALRFRTGRFGKPELADPFDMHQLRFSISHSGNRLAIAIVRASEVGVDIEQIRPMPDLPDLVDSVFSGREQSLFRSLEESSRLPTFFSVWAQKEAYLKARGLGLNRPPRDIDVGLFPVEGAGLIRDGWDSSATKQWSLMAWPPVQSYATALAVEGQHWRIDHMAEDSLPL
ncbi:4'-phosphopantetheinyl transferase family protein [Microvirga makkahensis]|uniref:4'-phosphopantetheinyl transferase superfamily protein n=1 Tax=Microvirga makkahensis TaxID=1128670 RepID=A0A7X3MV24_9HYPH|nr:4'-phosphopantetheinyl transferase superfamily protein [Microvirga makkahensis]MXQ13747.1 4'-phosphopantetheinyl transferase superfamily protein [Microvirga makkahensis]